MDVRKGAHALGGASLLLFCAVALIAWGLAGPNGVATIAAVKASAELNPALAAAVFSAAFVLLAALAVPAVWFMGLAAGALFGPWLGVPLALASAVAVATVALLIARHLLCDEVERRWPGLVRRLRDRRGPGRCGGPVRRAPHARAALPAGEPSPPA